MQFIRLLSYLALLLLPLNAVADVNIHKVSKDWGVLVIVDDFDDSVTCGATTLNPMKKGNPSIVLYITSASSYEHFGLLFANDSIRGTGIKYRVDKNPPVQLGYTWGNSRFKFYRVKGNVFDDMIDDFATGNSLVYKVTSSNQFVGDGAKAKISLEGFIEAYNLAAECNY